MKEVQPNMKEVQQRLMITFCAMIAGTIAMFAILEWLGVRQDSHANPAPTPAAAYIDMLLVPATLAAIVLSLKWFKLKPVSRQLLSNPLTALQAHGTVRIAMLEAVTMLNLIQYEFFGSASNAYLCIMSLLAMVFIVPTMSRCRQETNYYEDDL